MSKENLWKIFEAWMDERNRDVVWEEQKKKIEELFEENLLKENENESKS